MTYQYLICPPDYVPNSAGIWCLYNLCHLLNQRGYEAYIWDKVTVGAPAHLDAPIRSPGSFDDWRKVIAVYPEAVEGNPLWAPRVVRWELAKSISTPGHGYSPGELIFSYSDVFDSGARNKLAGKLFMPTLDSELFFPPKVERRDRDCYYIGKGKYIPGWIERQGLTEITRHRPGKADLADLLRRTRILYSFDNFTALNTEAVFCGAVVCMIPQDPGNWEHIRKWELNGTRGFVWGVDNLVMPLPVIDYQQNRLDLARVQADFQDQLTAFIAMTQTEGEVSYGRVEPYSHHTKA